MKIREIEIEHNSALSTSRLTLWAPCKLSSIEPEKVIFHNPATIIYWSDGSKTVVKCQEGDAYDPEKGLALCCAKKLLGNKSNFNNVFKKYLEKEVQNEEDAK